MSDSIGLPKGWSWTTVGEIASSFKNGIYKAKEFYSDKGVPCLRMYNIGDGRLVWKDIKRMDLSTDEMREYGLVPGDILVNRVNSRELVGKSCFIPSGTDACVFESKNIRLRLHGDVADPRYVNYRLLLAGRSHFSANAQQTVGMASISQDQLAAFEVPIAPLKEQRRIVAKVEELFADLDAGVAALQRGKVNLKRYRASLLKAAVEGALTAEWRAKHPKVEPASKLLERILKERRGKWEADQLGKFAAASKQPPKNWQAKYVEPQPPNTTDLSALPDGWCWASVEQVTALVTKGSSPGWQGFKYADDGVPFVRSQNVRSGALELDDLVFLPDEFNETHQTSIIRTGDVLLNLVGASIGRSAVATEAIHGANTNQAVGIIRLIDGSISNRLLVQILQSPQLQSHIAKTKADVARANFNLDDVRPTPIPLPPTSEQQVIVAEVAEKLSQIEAADVAIARSLLRAARLRQSILERAFEGKLVPQNPSDEPASVLLERIRASQTAQLPKRNGHRVGGRRPRRNASPMKTDVR